MGHDETLLALLEAHELICQEIGDVDQTREWDEGHVNGLKEARNRVEKVIMTRYGNSDE